MKLADAKTEVLNQCEREKRIVIMNIVLLTILIASVLFLIYRYALNFLLGYIANASTEVEGNQNSTYLKFAIPFAIILSLWKPVQNILKTISRKKKAIELFEHIEKGEDIKIIGTEVVYLTPIYLIWVKLKLNPVSYLAINTNTKLYDIPIPAHLDSEIRLALSGANTEKLQEIRDLIFSQTSNPEVASKVLPIPKQEQFNAFYNNELSEDVKSMEESRKTSKNIAVYSIVLIMIFMGCFVYYQNSNPSTTNFGSNLLKYIGVMLGFCIVVALGIMFYLKTKKTSKFADYTQFKKSVYSRLVKFLNPSFEYTEKGFISPTEFLNSGLFEENKYTISGSDQIAGIHNGVAFLNCNLSVSYRPQLRNEKEADDLVFEGNYLVARFNKTFKYPIYIFPKTSFFADFHSNDIDNYLDGTRNKIVLEDPDFDKQFTVYCDDQIMARYVLTPAFMDRLKAINQSRKGTLYVAINDQNIVFANNSTAKAVELDVLQTSLFRKIDKSLLDGLYQELASNLEMIDTLKLNVNIWKQAN